MSRGRTRQPLRTNQTERRQARREELLDAAVRAIRRDGPDLSMETLAAEGGVTKPILYRHFGDRGGLGLALAERFSAELLGELDVALQTPGEPKSILTTTIDAYVAFIERDPAIYRFLVQRFITEPGAALALEGFMRQIATRVALVLGEQLRALGADSGGAEPLANGIVGMVHAASEWWMERPTMPRARLVEYLTNLLWAGLAGMIPATTP